MSAHSVLGTDPAIATKLDAFWNPLPTEYKAALHTAFNLRAASEEYQGFNDDASELLRNSESGRWTIANVRGDFFNFMAEHINECPDAVTMMAAILAAM
jgi:hypothetical protein